MPATRRALAAEAKHLQIARQLRAEIDAGVLRDGQALPSTRALAQEWGVSNYTVSQALAQLTEDGLIATRDRAGSVVTAPHQIGLPRHGTPRVVLIGGYAGSGKSELGRILARATGWPILDKDTLTRPVVEVALAALNEPTHVRESETYLSTVRPAEYEALVAAITENLECGVSVIATAPFLREFANQAWLDRLTATTEGLGASTRLVWVYCDEDSMLTYLRRRGAARDAAKLAGWAGYLQGIDLDRRPLGDHTVIDNSQGGPPLQAQAHQLLRTLTGSASEG
ncbi:GntR family transcriptional regulator [Pseudonocardia sp. KRD291]|uniref:GntR family transcriptional regulator n=1 Tax=Pseudonocardia sp. KRD291 TaxID=2792007 RepID=UPI001C4A1F73|nr:GntR family transcriptional regulator [Pseudonocardia sp. KRD291]MBW0105800.1 GntR family transcriptional regulator [Pseudonocardia sp. KRD291]